MNKILCAANFELGKHRPAKFSDRNGTDHWMFLRLGPIQEKTQNLYPTHKPFIFIDY